MKYGSGSLCRESRCGWPVMNWKPVPQSCSAHKSSGCVSRDVACRETKTIPLLCLGHLNKDVVSTSGDYMSIKNCWGEPWEPAEHRRKDENMVCTKEEGNDSHDDWQQGKKKKKEERNTCSPCHCLLTVPYLNSSACRNTIIRGLWGHIRNFSDKWTFTAPVKKWINVPLAKLFTLILCDFSLSCSRTPGRQVWNAFTCS